ncbi:DNA polymerase III subunit beta [Candidatus Parcubacteria bacterium]|nr:DNA polymerase III subunit beta [Candidatus Parcubacteria bacterium]
MKITILKENFKNGLNIIERITGKNLTLPVLNNVLLTVEKNFLNLSTTDLEMGINWWGLVKTEKQGKISIPAKLLSSFTGLLPDKKIILEAKDKTLFIECEKRKTKIKGQDPEEFPLIPKIENQEFIEVDSYKFCQGLSQVIEVISSSQVRPEISGVYLLFQKDLIKMVGTDSFRLAEKTLSLKNKIKKECSLIIPQKTIRELINVLGEKKEKLKIFFSPSQIMFELVMPEISHPQVQIISRLIDGEYPDYQEIIPKNYETQIILEKKEFLNQIKTASLFSGNINEVKFKINPKEGKIEIFTQSSELGENKSYLLGKTEGNPIEVSFNHKFISDGLSNIESSEVIFGLNKDGGPAVLKPVGDESYIYVVMPVKSD